MEIPYWDIRNPWSNPHTIKTYEEIKREWWFIKSPNRLFIHSWKDLYLARKYFTKNPQRMVLRHEYQHKVLKRAKQSKKMVLFVSTIQLFNYNKLREAKEFELLSISYRHEQEKYLKLIRANKQLSKLSIQVRYQSVEILRVLRGFQRLRELVINISSRELGELTQLFPKNLHRFVLLEKLAIILKSQQMFFLQVIDNQEKIQSFSYSIAKLPKIKKLALDFHDASNLIPGSIHFLDWRGLRNLVSFDLRFFVDKEFFNTTCNAEIMKLVEYIAFSSDTFALPESSQSNQERSNLYKKFTKRLMLNTKELAYYRIEDWIKNLTNVRVLDFLFHPEDKGFGLIIESMFKLETLSHLIIEVNWNYKSIIDFCKAIKEIQGPFHIKYLGLFLGDYTCTKNFLDSSNEVFSKIKDLEEVSLSLSIEEFEEYDTLYESFDMLKSLTSLRLRLPSFGNSKARPSLIQKDFQNIVNCHLVLSVNNINQEAVRSFLRSLTHVQHLSLILVASKVFHSDFIEDIKGLKSLKAIHYRNQNDKLTLRQIEITLSKFFRSEERRVGKECRSRWSPYH